MIRMAIFWNVWLALSPHVQNYLVIHFTSKVQHVDPLLIEKVQTEVTHYMTEMLMAPYTQDDVRKVVFNIIILKNLPLYLNLQNIRYRENSGVAFNHTCLP